MTSTIKVNNVQNQCGANIINESSNTITIGASGDTIALASGASQTGFGRTGTVDWDTTKKTASFTATSGDGFFVDTTSSALTVTLPASPSAGDIVAVADYAGTAGSNNITIARNGSNIEGGTENASIDVNRESKTFVYVDATQGWVVVNSNDTSAIPPAFLTASGGTETTSGNYKIHTFTGPGTFTVCVAGAVAANNIVSYMVVAGGAGGGGSHGAGGGAGGFREYKGPADCYTASPLNGNPGGTAITVTAQTYPITVGAGGTAGTTNTSNGGDGGNSVFSTVTSAGGGGGATESLGPGRNGGSGGGGTYNPNHNAAGTGNTPPVSPPQGQPGGVGHPQNPPYHAGGGGGAKDAGSAYNSFNGAGGDGQPTSITGSATTYAGGGGAGGTSYGQSGGGAGGAGGGGAGACGSGSGNAATANTGGGGGGGYAAPACNPGGSGGSGIVVIRYKYQ